MSWLSSISGGDLTALIPLAVTLLLVLMVFTLFPSEEPTPRGTRPIPCSYHQWEWSGKGFYCTECGFWCGPETIKQHHSAD